MDQASIVAEELAEELFIQVVALDSLPSHCLSKIHEVLQVFEDCRDFTHEISVIELENLKSQALLGAAGFLKLAAFCSMTAAEKMRPSE